MVQHEFAGCKEWLAASPGFCLRLQGVQGDDSRGVQDGNRGLVSNDEEVAEGLFTWVAVVQAHQGPADDLQSIGGGKVLGHGFRGVPALSARDFLRGRFGLPGQGGGEQDHAGLVADDAHVKGFVAGPGSPVEGQGHAENIFGQGLERRKRVQELRVIGCYLEPDLSRVGVFNGRLHGEDFAAAVARRPCIQAPELDQ